MNSKHFEIIADFAYIEKYIPPRCRKPREREITGSCTVKIPSISADIAPIAMRHKTCWEPKEIIYRWYNGTLFTRSLYRHYLSNAKGFYPIDEMTKQFRGYIPHYLKGKDEASSIRACQERANRYLIIDGDQVWERIGEPRYVIATFGLGHNHASTALMIENNYNDNIRGDFYFNALNRKNAIKKCVEVALARGDTDSIDQIKESWEIEVLIPEAVQCNPEQETGPGNGFLNMLEHITEVSNSAEEAAVLAIAATGIKNGG